MLQRVGCDIEPSPLLTGLSVAEKEMGVPLGKVPFRTFQGCVEFHRGVRDRLRLEITAKIRDRLVRTDTQTADD